ncbi:phosphoadenosine phosphosulfate reductase family protein [Sulfurimonas sp.]|uniref:phosphoadenosine phosphosulfate reductase family protein n=1 Tax=Sulfurimonas sp. TaxID=2022749 RepID=UPI0025CFB09A|nr:phosphoadenosine phosphosulfate reductase family protein [Sulfurimonas sp.]
MKYLLSLSGGKDSTACLLWALDTLPKEDIIPYYIDTKWEHDDVYKYLDYLEEKLEIKITRLESEGMEALSIRKKCMPNSVMRFCTENLKVKPALEFYKTIKDDFINIVGVRREESKKRANTESFTISQDGIKTLFPVAYWTTQRVFDYHKEHNIEVNPLYKRGFSRVGCYPCIYARKHELQNMEPKYKTRLRNLEKKIGEITAKAGFDPKKATFFPPKKDKYLRDGLDLKFDENYCVNQYGICE